MTFLMTSFNDFFNDGEANDLFSDFLMIPIAFSLHLPFPLL